MTFIVRLSTDERGRISGVVERVATGKKDRFHGLDQLGPLLARMARDDVDLSDVPDGDPVIE